MSTSRSRLTPPDDVRRLFRTVDVHDLLPGGTRTPSTGQPL